MSTNRSNHHQVLLTTFQDAFHECLRQVPDAFALYKNKKAWTRFMLGDKSDHGKYGVLPLTVKRWAESVGKNSSSLHHEWAKFDLMLVEPSFEVEQTYWQTKAGMLVEHENEGDIETEMWPLAHWQSNSTVLVFYDWNESDRNALETKKVWLEQKLDTLSEIVRHVDRWKPERHLLIIGNLNVDQQLQWRFSEWTNGRFSNPQLFFEPDW